MTDIDSDANGRPGPEAPDRPRRAVAAAFGGLVAAAVGGPEGATAGAVAAVAIEPLIDRVWQEVSSDGKRRGMRVIERAIDLSDCDITTFEQAAIATEQTRLLTGSAISAATRSAYAPKIEALARALASGLANEAARVDDEQLFVAALTDLEAPHVRLLDLLVHYGPEWGSLGSPTTTAELLGTEEPTAWRIAHIIEVRPQLEPVLPGLLGTLQRHGLANVDNDLATAFRNYGREVDRATRAIARGGRHEASPSPLTPSMRVNLNMAEITPEITWQATTHGAALLSYLTDTPAERL